MHLVKGFYFPAIFDFRGLDKDPFLHYLNTQGSCLLLTLYSLIMNVKFLKSRTNFILKDHTFLLSVIIGTTPISTSDNTAIVATPFLLS